MKNSNRCQAQPWPYPHHKEFQSKIRSSNAEWFKNRGYKGTPDKPYILEQKTDWPKNMILEEVARYVQAENISSLHDIHNGTSSQAMLFNLFGPLVVQKDLTPFKQALESADIVWPMGKVVPYLEFESRKIFNEGQGKPTSIDLVLKGAPNARSLFIEAKLVEDEFGRCSSHKKCDCKRQNPSQNFALCYLHQRGRRYWELMEKHGFLSGPCGTSPICPLALYYQFFREVLFAIELGGDFVLLYDARNPTFYCPGALGERGLMPFLLTFVPEALRSRVHSISIQQVVETYRQYQNLTWVAEFEKKYDLI